MSDTELIKDLFEGVIDDNALAKLSKEELDAINNKRQILILILFM